MSKTKVLVIGMDSADSQLLTKWCDSGELPVLKALRERSVYGELTSPDMMGDDAAWASFCTSVSPAQHGRFFWKSFQSGSYSSPMFRDHNWKHESFWDVLSRAGKQVAVIDVPKCRLSKDLNGIQLANWLVHGRDRDTCSWPDDFADNIITRYGDDYTDRYNVGEFLCCIHTLPEDKLRLLIQRLLDSVERKLAVAIEVLSRGKWDLFITVFKECHCVGHQLWHLLDEKHPQYDEALSCELGDSIKRVYQMVDKSIGELLKLIDDEATVIIFSTLGMGPNYTGEPYLDEILMRLESPIPLKFQPTFRKLKAVQNKLKAKFGGNYDIDRYAHRKAFQLEHNEISGAIRFNLKGREPAGRIQPGRELDEFSANLIQDLMDLIDPTTGNPVVQRVVRTDTLFEGNHKGCLPDLLVEWRRDSPITAVASKKIGEIRSNVLPYRTGNHTANGIYFAQGSRIAGRQNPDSASLMDIGPTIAALLNTDLPDVQGKPIAAICD